MSKKKEVQKAVDKFYIAGGKKPVCAGCDWWRFYGATVGECTKSAPVSAKERLAFIGMESISINVGAGHVITPRHHSCGDFIDTYDW